MAAFPVAALSAPQGVQVFAHPISETLQSPCEADTRVAATLGRRGPHFLGGRLAARAALQALEGPDGHVPRGAAGEPMWPAGFVGSISHTPGMAIAMVGRQEVILSCGIDIERRDRVVAQAASRHVCHPEERGWALGDDLAGVDPLLLLVSAKEVVFKTYFPPSRLRLGFQDAALQPAADGLVARLLRPLPAPLPSTLAIRRTFVSGFLVQAGWLVPPHAER